MILKKTLSLMVVIILLANILLFAFRQISVQTFWIVIALSAIAAWAIKKNMH